MGTIEVLNKMIEDAANKHPYDDTFSVFLSEYLLSNGVSVRPWIDVKDKLPTTDGCFEVTIKNRNGKCHIGICNCTPNAKSKDAIWGGANVIAWRERELPYKSNKV